MSCITSTWSSLLSSLATMYNYWHTCSVNTCSDYSVSKLQLCSSFRPKIIGIESFLQGTHASNCNGFVRVPYKTANYTSARQVDVHLSEYLIKCFSQCATVRQFHHHKRDKGVAFLFVRLGRSFSMAAFMGKHFDQLAYAQPGHKCINAYVREGSRRGSGCCMDSERTMMMAC